MPSNLVKLEHCGELYCGQSPSVAEVNTDGRGQPYFTGPEQWDGRTLHVEKWTEHPKRLVPEGCIFITVKGAGVGKLFPGIAGAIGRDIYAFRVHEALNFKYILYALRHTIDTVVGQAKGDIPGLSRNHILDHLIVLPSVAQQNRIVAKIEELFSELDKGGENLATAKQQLKVYRQAILKHAFEGKLTADWRAQNPDKLKTPEALLLCIGTERDARHAKAVEDWQRAVVEWRAAGEIGDRPVKPRQPSDEQAEKGDAALWPEVPSCWATVQLGMLNVEIFDGPFGSNLKTSDYVEHGVRVVRLENIGLGRFIDEKLSFVSEEKYEHLKKHTVFPGDIVFSSFVTDAIRSATIPKSTKFAVNKADCFGVRFFGSAVGSEFVQRFIESRNAFKQVEGMIHGVGRPRINTTQLKQVVVPVCTPDEQAEIIEILERVLSEIEALRL